MAKQRSKKVSTNWRLIWFQLVDGVRRMRWHTGPFGECEVLRQACVAAGEEHTLSEPGKFK